MGTKSEKSEKRPRVRRKAPQPAASCEGRRPSCLAAHASLLRCATSGMAGRCPAAQWHSWLQNWLLAASNPSPYELHPSAAGQISRQSDASRKLCSRRRAQLVERMAEQLAEQLAERPAEQLARQLPGRLLGKLPAQLPGRSASTKCLDAS